MVQSVSPLGTGTPEPIRTWPLRVPDQTTGFMTDVCLRSSLGLNIEISFNVFIIHVVKKLGISKYCALLSYTQFIITIGLKTDSLFKGASSGAQWPVVQYTSLKKGKVITNK